jgi:predicted acyltransferase
MHGKSAQVETVGTTQRLVSLDLLRGLTVIGMIIVNEMAGMQSEGPVYPTLLHERWNGLHLADVVFPAFLLMVGISIAISMSKPGAVNAPDAYRHILWRSVRLVVLGWLLSNMWWFMDFHATSWRLFGVLQRIGFVYGACALMFLWMSPRARLITAAAILVLYWPLVLLGAGNHNYVKGPEGYDPEGLLGTFPAIAQGLIGVAIGEYLLRAERRRLRTLAIAGAGMLLVGIAWGSIFPVVKDIWSSTFALVTSGIATLTLAALSYVFDGKPLTGGRYIFGLAVLPFGMNAIAAYVLHEVSGAMLGWDLLQQPYRSLVPRIGPELAAFVPVGIFLLFIWACMFYLWRRKWLIRI